MIKKFVFGNPINTQAVVEDFEELDYSKLPEIFSFSEDYSEFKMELDPEDIIYGLGESLHGMNKRGFIYVSNNTDQVHHDENQYSLYGSHNFILIDRFEGFKLGLFVDYPAKTKWDLGFTDKDIMSVSVEEPDYKLYIVEGETALDIIKEFRRIIGKSYKAPLWGFGYGQSRWGYKCTEDVRKIVREHKRLNLPIDSVYMDIDYMQDYAVFTINDERYPEFADFVKEMEEEKIHLVPAIDPAVKRLPGYYVYDEGVEGNYFCKDESGNDFPVAVWPGLSHLPDFFKPETKKWFGDKYRFFTDLGIDGFWNDMNEPAIFYSSNSIKKTADYLATMKDKTENLTLGELWDYLDAASGLANNEEDYKSFYHEIDGKKVRHDRVHNLYALNMMQGVYENFKEIAPGKEILFFARSSYIGSHRYGGIWTGDNSSYYSHIQLILSQLPNLNMCGFLYVGADTGGFAFNTSEPLLMRFMQISLFTPLFRNHCALGTRDQEIYQFKDIDSFRGMLNLRYALIPELYKIYTDSIENNKMMFTPLALAYPGDKKCRQVGDQLMLGDDYMIAPVTEANATGRYVYVPENMKCYIMKSHDKYRTVDLPKGHHYINIAINEVAIFVKEGKVLNLCEPGLRTE
ncbi:MAG: alpha-glucosidase [Lachnospiraceae bacterium]|nr:alpha-glucosidase [Lachnospiraceae bacterium]